MSTVNSETIGKIVSFYSFKGGVGRTMALANVAFLAAMNGLNVLVMDWDLEAPGLHYYFRGIVEPDTMNEVKLSKGILDLAWQWRIKVEQAQAQSQVEALFEEFQSGSPFDCQVQNIFRGDDFRELGLIDIITAGGERVDIPNEVSYEEALASFSWREFLDKYTGGGMLQSLRDWATKKYDLVLIDSRTGLADVAGICTMQLPDAVVLAFVLNRQNIEGIARVAGAIRANRGDAITIWPVPMRVSREGTAEEADASARAVRELVRIGNLDREAIERDMRGLLIKAEPNVPFMESLSAFNTTDAALDPMTANFARLTKEIAGISITIPEIDERWRDIVSSRLAPALSTEAYLRQLMSAEPSRAARELHQYVESAISTLADADEVPAAYVTALAEATFAMQQRGDLLDGIEEYDTLGRLALLLRRLYERDHDRWRSLLIDALQNALDSNEYLLDEEDVIVALEEIDDLLEAQAEGTAVLLRRAEIKQKTARSYSQLGESALQLAAADEAILLLNKAKRLPGAGETDEIRIAQCEALSLKAEADRALAQPDESAAILKQIIKFVDEIKAEEHRNDAMRLAFDANYWLLIHAREQGNTRDAGKFALAAVTRGLPNSPLFLHRLPEIAETVLDAPSSSIGAAEMLKRIFTLGMPPANFAHFFGRVTTSAARFLKVLTRLLISSHVQLSKDDQQKMVEFCIDIARGVLVATDGRLTTTSQRRSRSLSALIPTLVESVVGFVIGVQSLGVSGKTEEDLTHLANDAQEMLKRMDDAAPDVMKRRRPRPR